LGGTITHVLGARPNFVKAAPVIRALAALGYAQRVVHTGQHYDERMSEIFFVQLGLPRPDVNLGVGSGTQARQTAEVMVGMEDEFTRTPPALAVVYGDVNSTIGASLAGAKLGVPLAHVEAGLRSFDDTMPEEINRRLTDQLCSLLFVTSPEAIGYLAREGRPAGAVHFVGNPMIDTLLANLPVFDASAARAVHGLGDRRYVVATLHRPANVDAPAALAPLVEQLLAAARRLRIVFAVHPRTRQRLTDFGLLDRLTAEARVTLTAPLSYVPFMRLVTGAAAVITDSGGVQQETTYLGIACLTLRDTTEWGVTLEQGTNSLVRPDQLAATLDRALANPPDGRGRPDLWDGRSAARCVAALRRRANAA
jgi:UDP-N-acetylglucosamine 2-epimerase (non-hydrolysing)